MYRVDWTGHKSGGVIVNAMLSVKITVLTYFLGRLRVATNTYL